MNEEQIVAKAYEYLESLRYWTSPEAKEIGEDTVLGFLDFMFPEGEQK